MALYVNGEKMTYFDSSEVEHISKEIRKFISNKNIKTNIFRIQAKGSIMCGEYVPIGFIDFMLKNKSFLDDTNLFSPRNT